jgi:hypothetical protein
MKTCSRCDITHSGSHSWCNDCRNAYSKEYYLNNRDKILGYAKVYGASRRASLQDLVNEFKDVPCSDCGIKYPPYVMDFDHILQGKEFAVGHGVANGYSKNRLLEEIKKCEVVCSNCHRERTHTRKLLGNKR